MRKTAKCSKSDSSLHPWCKVPEVLSGRGEFKWFQVGSFTQTDSMERMATARRAALVKTSLQHVELCLKKLQEAPLSYCLHVCAPTEAVCSGCGGHSSSFWVPDEQVRKASLEVALMRSLAVCEDAASSPILKSSYVWERWGCDTSIPTEFAPALQLSAKKPTNFWGLVKASAQLWFHPEATTHLAKQNFLKHLSSCLCKNQSSDAIRQCEKSQLCWSHSFESWSSGNEAFQWKGLHRMVTINCFINWRHLMAGCVAACWIMCPQRNPITTSYFMLALQCFPWIQLLSNTFSFCAAAIESYFGLQGSLLQTLFLPSLHLFALRYRLLVFDFGVFVFMFDALYGACLWN